MAKLGIITCFLLQQLPETHHNYTLLSYHCPLIFYHGYEKVKPLIQAMLNYGTYAQTHFGYNLEHLALENASVAGVTVADLASFAGTGTQGTAKAPLISVSLILKTETTMRLYFQPTADVESLTVTLNGEPLPVTVKRSYSYVDVTNISAKDLDTSYIVVVNDGFETVEVTYNPMTYCYNVLNAQAGTYQQDLVDLVKALYLYNQAANAYFETAR